MYSDKLRLVCLGIYTYYIYFDIYRCGLHIIDGLQHTLLDSEDSHVLIIFTDTSIGLHNITFNVKQEEQQPPLQI